MDSGRTSRIIESIRALDLNALTVDEIMQRLRLLPLPLAVTVLKKGAMVFRTRPIEDFPRHIRELSYPYKPEYVSGFGRCNFPGQMIFYGAVDARELSEVRVTGVSETMDFDKIDRRKRSFVATGKWEVMSDVYLAELVLDADSQKNPVTKQAGAFHQQQLRQLDKERRAVHEQILRFHSQELSRRNANYKLTSAISNLFYELELPMLDSMGFFRLEGISYPSVETDGKGMNVAILPATVDLKLQPRMVLINEVVPSGEKEFFFHNYEIATQISSDGIIRQYNSC
jgi:hypothetical protein